jgi:predicted  nucleic acid-binding Zn-ribbon protein
MNRGIAPLKRGPWPAIPVGAVLLLTGCFFDQLQRSEENDIQRVEQKQATLQTEQYRSVALKQQEEQLATELSERQLSLNQLNDRVQEINAENGRAIADNDATRLQYNDLLGQLHETNEQLALAQQGTAGSIEERRERIASLKARLKAQLDLLLR